MPGWRQPQLGRRDGPRANLRQRWLSRAAGQDRKSRCSVDGNVVRGIFETIDEDCRFVIRSGSGEIVKIAAGDVHFGAVASRRRCMKRQER